jgi:hypothetical protein
LAGSPQIRGENMTVHKLKTSATKSVKISEPSAEPTAGVAPNQAGLRKILLARRLGAHLKKVRPEQKLRDADRVCEALIKLAINGDIKAIQLIFELTRLLDEKPERGRSIEITPDMPLEMASRLYLESIKRTLPDETDEEG